MSLSFINPFVDGRIWVPGGKTIDLTFIGEDKLPFVESVEIEVGTAMNFEISVNFTPTYDAAVDLIDNTDWFRLGNTLGVRWGYNDGNPAHISDWMYGFIQLPIPAFGDEISLGITANGVGWNLSKNESTRVWGTVKNPTSLETIFETIAKKYGLKLVWSIGLDQEEYFSRKLAYLQAGLTDYQFLERYARHCIAITGKSSPVTTVFKGKELHLISSNKEKPAPAAEFHMYGKPDPANNIYPMNSFTPENYGALFLPHRTYSSAVYGANSHPADPVKKVDSAGNKSAGEAAGKENNTGGKETVYSTGVDADPNPDTGLKYDVPDDIQMEAGKHVPVIITAESEDQMAHEVQSQIDNARQQDASDFGLKVNFGAMAVPKLVPMQYVRLRGVTGFFSTDYRLSNLKISIGDGGADMECDAQCVGIPEGFAWIAQEVATSETGETVQMRMRGYSVTHDGNI